MRSIVALGDFQFNLLLGPKGLATKSHFVGGVALTESAIFAALINSHPLSLPWIASYDSDLVRYQENPQSPRDGVRRWEVGEKEPVIDSDKRFCLFNPAPSGQGQLGFPDKKLVEWLNTGDFAGPPALMSLC